MSDFFSGYHREVPVVGSKFEMGTDALEELSATSRRCGSLEAYCGTGAYEVERSDINFAKYSRQFDQLVVRQQGEERDTHLELVGCLPERSVILVKLHCVGKHELDVLRKLSNIRTFLPLKVFLRKGLSKSLLGVVM
jgi:hypothetical protein